MIDIPRNMFWNFKYGELAFHNGYNNQLIKQLFKIRLSTLNIQDLCGHQKAPFIK